MRSSVATQQNFEDLRLRPQEIFDQTVSRTNVVPRGQRRKTRTQRPCLQLAFGSRDSRLKKALPGSAPMHWQRQARPLSSLRQTRRACQRNAARHLTSHEKTLRISLRGEWNKQFLPLTLPSCFYAHHLPPRLTMMATHVRTIASNTSFGKQRFSQVFKCSNGSE